MRFFMQRRFNYINAGIFMFLTDAWHRYGFWPAFYSGLVLLIISAYIEFRYNAS